MDVSDVVYRHVGLRFLFQFRSIGDGWVAREGLVPGFLDRHKQPSGLHQLHRSCSVQAAALET
jgi:hypothetical protein